jgi:hypothetical protein
MARGMKLFPSVHFVYDHALFRATIVIACIVVIETHCTKSIQVELTMIMFAKVRKLFMVMTISTHFHVWWRKR